MKERPILFNSQMVRALLDGSKTQTRRVVKSWNPKGIDNLPVPADVAYLRDFTCYRSTCPYGQPGDRLWVRETWGVVSNVWDEDGNLVDWVPDRPATAIVEMPFGQGYYSGHAIYAADGYYEWAGDDDGGGEPRSAWHPSIHMPRAASRILLEIVSVRVERLHDIGTEEIEAEGVVTSDASIMEYGCRARVMDFTRLWEGINGAGSWDANPWVWVVEFKRVAP
jgi:putative SOS response-associated peptidase YedK